MAILVLFIIWLLSNLAISYFIPNIIPYLGSFPYKDLLDSYRLPEFLTAFANFDGAHYVSIAGSGYHQFEQAFFPLYPLLMNIITPIFKGNYLLAGLIISNVSFFLGLYFFWKYVVITLKGSKIPKKNKASRTFLLNVWPLILLLSFPTSFFFGAVYTEGLFFLLVILTFYYLQKEKFLHVAIFAFLASLTRLIGVFLIIPILLSLIKESLSFPRRRESNKQLGFTYKYQFINWIPAFAGMTTNILNTKYFILILSPLLGLALYTLYLWQTTGDPFLFFNAHASFNLNRSTHLILLPQVFYRYLKILFTAAHNFQYYIALLEITTFGLVLFVLLLDLLKIVKNFKTQISYNRLGLNLFSLSNLLLPTLTGTFLSIPRFSLISLSMFIYLAEIKNTWIKTVIAVIFLILHVIILGFFVQGYFVS